MTEKAGKFPENCMKPRPNQVKGLNKPNIATQNPWPNRPSVGAGTGGGLGPLLGTLGRLLGRFPVPIYIIPQCNADSNCI